MMDIDLKGTGRWSSSRRAPYQYSINSWTYFAKKYNAELFVMEDVIVPHEDMGICWQRYYVFDILKQSNIEYNQILLVDADTIVHPECPNIFELTNNKLTGIHNDGSYDWVLRSLENYAHYVFSGYQSKFQNYIDCGFIIANRLHEDFFANIVKFYWEQQTLLKEMEKMHVGTDQTPFNILVQREGIELNLLPYEFNMVDLPRKEILTDDLLFTKLGWVYQFNCIPNNTDNQATYYWMKKTYEHLYG